MSEWYDESHKARPYHMVELATGKLTGTNDAVSLRIACSTGKYKPVQDTGGMIDPLRNYDNMNTDQLLDRCIARGITGYMEMNRAQQIMALRRADAEHDAEMAAQAAPAPQPLPKLKKGKGKHTEPEPEKAVSDDS